MEQDQHWTSVIKPKSSPFQLNLKEIWEYRDLLILFVRRDIVATYKQTLLGPLWLIIQPILTSVVYALVFSGLASIPVDNSDPFLFYLCGTTAWIFFSDCLTKTSSTFVGNASIFGKVYFPRMVVPLSIVLSALFKLGIQLVILFIVMAGMYFFKPAAQIHPNKYIILLPVLVLIMGGLGLGFGIFISSVTTKYRDFTYLVGFGVQLLMFATPVIYPLSEAKKKGVEWLVSINPMSSVIETFRYGLLGNGTYNSTHLIYSFVFMVVFLLASIVIFNKVEKNFMDTV
jgi:lipopolysaccharide transport system permease protein